ncbi:MAG: hypothetical protein HYR66_00215 [Sphingobacteriales bacterium]|nr:hypothetical protein [Sphingobacteriales bacterium]MBI3719652.1 hypothetical protein [Sphingobacteriales bacterium]
MKKLYLKLFALIFLSVLLHFNVQSQKNNKEIVISIGVYSQYGYPSKLTSTENSGIPTAGLGGDYRLSKLFSIGLYAAYTYSFFKYDDPNVGYKDVWKGWDAGLRGTLHIGEFFLKNKKYDIYLAVFSGYTKRSMIHDKSNIYRDSLNFKESAFSIGSFAGVRFFTNKKIGFFIETGLSRKFIIGGGLSFKLANVK